MQFIKTAKMPCQNKDSLPKVTRPNTVDVLCAAVESEGWPVEWLIDRRSVQNGQPS